MRDIEIREIRFGSEEYKAELELRDRVLRRPLGLVFPPEYLAPDAVDIHIGAFAGETLLGCLVLNRLPEGAVKMRQVAVDQSCQSRGIGKALVKFSENLARERGFVKIELNAREPVVPFYLALGYELYGDPFEEVTIPHRQMRKGL